jgi:acylpyruvate hydrolase
VRLASISTDGGRAAAVVHNDRTVTVLTDYDDVGALLGADPSLAVARRAVEDGEREPLNEDRLRRPVLNPGAVVCVGLNYRTHILEMGRDLPKAPTLFSKLARTLADPFADIVLPADSQKVDYEAELGVVIGRPGRDIDPADALSHVAGLTVVNDVTMRDFQRRTTQWFAGKAFEATTPVGPWIVTLDELDDLEERELSLRVNGEERQRAAIGDLVFGIAALVSDLSRIVTVAPGDLIATGTPGGVGDAGGEYLAAGDVVEVSVDGVGTIRNSFRDASS